MNLPIIPKKSLITGAVLLFMFGLCTSTALSQREHPGQVIPYKAEEKPRITKEDVAKFAEEYVRKNSKDGVFRYLDKNTGKELELVLEKVHKDRLSPTRTDEYFVCADFKGKDGNTYDLDFFVQGTDKGSLKVDKTSIAIHKVNGKENYTWEYNRKKDLWEKKVIIIEKEYSAPANKIRIFEFTYLTEVNDLPEDAKQISIWLPYPKNDVNQKITPLKILSPYPTNIYKDDEYGNYILYVSARNPECRSIKVEMKFRVRRCEYIRKGFEQMHKRTRNVSGPMLKRWLLPDQLVPVDDRIKRLAADVTQDKATNPEKVRAIYDYTIDNLTYDKSGTGWGRGDICHAFEVKRGNCTDFHAVFIGLCRAVGIPAKFAIGFSLPAGRGQGEIDSYHCWAEFYLKGYGWIPVDVSEGYKDPAKKEYFFGAHDENRVQLTVGRDIVLNPPQGGKPLNYFIYPYVEVDGKPFSRVQHKFLFRDLATKNTPGNLFP